CCRTARCGSSTPTRRRSSWRRASISPDPTGRAAPCRSSSMATPARCRACTGPSRTPRPPSRSAAPRAKNPSFRCDDPSFRGRAKRGARNPYPQTVVDSHIALIEGIVVMDSGLWPSASPGMTDRMTERPITRALLSVSDKTGLVDFARALAGHGIELISTGGTAKALAEAGLTVRDVSDLTGFPEMMDGRVKTLHPKVHGGLLAIRDDAAHAASMKAHGIAPIDLLAVNLYPFEATVAKGADFATCIENIDIGGPAMIRAAAKNHNDVAVVVDPADYTDLLSELGAHKGATTLTLRRTLAAKAYARTASYDS